MPSGGLSRNMNVSSGFHFHKVSFMKNLARRRSGLSASVRCVCSFKKVHGSSKGACVTPPGPRRLSIHGCSARCLSRHFGFTTSHSHSSSFSTPCAGAGGGGRSSSCSLLSPRSSSILCLSSRFESASASQSGAGITDVSFSGGGSGETSSSSSSSLTTLPAQTSSSSFSSSSSSDNYSDHSQVLVYLTRNNNSLNSAEENNLNEVVSKHDVQDAELAAKTGGEQRRRAVLASRAFCRCVLARTLREHGLGEWEPAELPLSRDKNGKPALNISSTGKGNVAFSVSHTTGLLACAVSLGGRTVGVDIENGDRALRGSPEDRARRLFSQDEADDVARRGNGAFLEKWTLKEAYLKATGEGINARRRLRDVTFTYEPLTWHDEDGHAGVGVRVNDASPPKAFADIPSLRWGVHLTHLPALEHVMAVCVLDDDRADDYKSDYEMPHLLEPQMWLTDTLATDVTRL